MTEPVDRKKSDLGVRTISALVMLVVAGGALWLGGWWWSLLVGLIAAGVLWEWWGLVRRFAASRARRATWLFAGAAYIAAAASFLVAFREAMLPLMIIVLGVIGTDVGAYFSGRTFGGPKIAPSISPSKTWTGLAGGVVGASAMVFLVTWLWHAGLCDRLLPPQAVISDNTAQFDGPCSFSLPPLGYWLSRSALFGTLAAVVAQCGDFFESWMKRKAGLKDSSSLIPGHGGLFDRLDGLLAVTVVVGFMQIFWSQV